MSRQQFPPSSSDQLSYSIDTSSLIESWKRRYPMEIFIGFWQWLSELISEGRLVASEMVRQELNEKDEEPKYWCDNHPSFFIPVDLEIQQHIRDFLADWPELVKEGKDRDKNLADAFVVALAKRDGLIVVTEEKHDKKYSIPQICKRHNIRQMNILELMQEENITFTLHS